MQCQCLKISFPLAIRALCQRRTVKFLLYIMSAPPLPREMTHLVLSGPSASFFSFFLSLSFLYSTFYLSDIFPQVSTQDLYSYKIHFCIFWRHWVLLACAKCFTTILKCWWWLPSLCYAVAKVFWMVSRELLSGCLMFQVKWISGF